MTAAEIRVMLALLRAIVACLRNIEQLLEAVLKPPVSEEAALVPPEARE